MLIVTFISCEKDIGLSPKPITVEQAKNFFEIAILNSPNKKDITSKAASGQRRSLLKQALWNYAFIKKISLGDAVVVPLHYDKSAPYIEAGKNKHALSLDNISYLMMYKNREGQIQTELVTWMPDDEYWDDKNRAKKSFNGIVVVEDWNGEFIKGYKFDKDGKISPLKPSNSLNSANAVKIISVDCFTVAYSVCVGDTCYTQGYDTYCTLSFTNDGGGSGGAAYDYPPSGGGGSTPGGGTPTTNPCGGAISGGTNVSVAMPCDVTPVPNQPVAPISIIVFKIGVHKEITKNAAIKEGFCASAVSSLMNGVAATDYLTLGGTLPNTSQFHFDGLNNMGEIATNWVTVNSLLKTAIVQNNYFSVGMYTHAFQDFYAHSNYAELLIKFYGNDLNNISFTDLLQDDSHKYDTFKLYLNTNLKTGQFDLVSEAFEVNSYYLGIDYMQTHSYINKDQASTYAGKYAFRLAERESRQIVSRMNKKCN